MKFSNICFLPFAFIVSCAGAPPKGSYVLAQTALTAAERSQAQKYASDYFYQAQKLFVLGEKHFKEKKFKKAESFFFRSRKHSERAEERARLKLNEKGEIF